MRGAVQLSQYCIKHSHSAPLCPGSRRSAIRKHTALIFTSTAHQKNTAALLNTKHRGAGLTPTSEFVMQRFGELSVQADQRPCCTRFSLQPRVTLQITETNNAARVNFPMVNSCFHVSTKLILESAASLI